jgi:Ser/Thr protein kinase RdoA (MazF antagonist)
MSPDEPLDPPSTEAVRDAAAATRDRPVESVTPIDEGLNAVYRLRFQDDEAAVLKVATLTPDPAFLAESRLLALLEDTDVPAPSPLVSLGTEESPFEAAALVTEHLPGEQVTDVFALRPAAYEQFVREAGQHLAALHGIDIAAHIETRGGQYGDLQVPGGDCSEPLTVVDAGLSADDPVPGLESWPGRLETVVDRVAAGLEGQTYTTDGDFSDLVPVVRDAVADADLPTTPPLSALHLDYRPANALFDPAAVDEQAGDADAAATGSDVVRGVLDFGEPETGDGLLDLALAEDALVGVPLGGTDRGERLASALRQSYAANRSGDVAFDERYTAYLLLARASRLGSVGYFWQFAREDEKAAAVERWQNRIRTLAGRIASDSSEPGLALRHEEQ